MKIQKQNVFFNIRRTQYKLHKNFCKNEGKFVLFERCIYFFFSIFNFLIEKTFQLLKKEKKEKRVKGLETEKKIRSN